MPQTNPPIPTTTRVWRSPSASTATSTATAPSDIAQTGSTIPAFFDLICQAQTAVKTTMSAIKVITATVSGGMNSSMSIFCSLDIDGIDWRAIAITTRTTTWSNYARCPPADAPTQGSQAVVEAQQASTF